MSGVYDCIGLCDTCILSDYFETSSNYIVMLLQDRTPVTGKPEKLMDLKGSDLLGLPVKVRVANRKCSI